MSDEKALIADLQRSVDEAKRAAVIKGLKDSIPLEYHSRPPPPAKKAKAARPRVTWVERDSNWNVVHAKPRPTRNRSNQAGPSRKDGPGACSQKPVPPIDLPDTISEVSVAPVALERFLQELQHSLSVASADIEEAPTPTAPLLASSDWATRNRSLLERWRAQRPQLINSTAAKQNVGTRMCQQCAVNAAAVSCHGCEPRPFLCAGCDIIVHTDMRNVFHNRNAMTAGFFQPLSPTTCIEDKAHCHCERFVPVRIPDNICSCPDALRVNPGKNIAVITQDGRYDLRMPDLSCNSCKATWTAGVDHLIHRNYWPATPQFSTVYDTDVFFSFHQMKMASPGLSCQAFLRMLQARTVHFGRTGTICADSFLKSYFQWEVVQFEVDNICKEEPFSCPACTPEMVAISVDGNRKLYRFKSAAARSEEQAIFDGKFIASDEDVSSFVDYIHQTTNHVSGRGVCGGQWSAARETSKKSTSNLDEEGLELAVCRHGVLHGALNVFRGEIFAYPLYLQNQLASRKINFFCMDVACKYWPYLQKVSNKCPELKQLLDMKPFLSVFHAKAHDFKCEVKWSGQYQDGAGQTLGEEVEQCNAFLSRIGVTTKHMSKAGRTDMLTLMAMRWNQQKFANLATSLSRRYRKCVKDLQSQLQNLESMKVDFAVAESQLEDWVKDVQEWAETTTTTADEPDALANSIEMMVTSIKRRSQRLYRDNDGNKARARLRTKIRRETEILTSVVERYNAMVPSTESLCMDTILTVDTAWPWQLQDGDYVGLKKKRKAFDTIMAVRRLKEEKEILVTEMEHHWRTLSACARDLKEMSCIVCSGTMTNSWDLSEDGLRGLHCIILKKEWDMRKVMMQSRACYMQALSGAENVTFLDNSDEDYDSGSDMSDDDLV